MPVQPGAGGGGQGKAVPVEQTVVQLQLPIATAEDPCGSAREVAWDRSRVGRAGVPKAIVTEGKSTLAMMEEVIARVDSAMKKVVANKGAPGPDGMTVSQLREQWPAIAPRLRADLLSGAYRPGGVRRVMIPKAGGGQRGLGIPNVVDRVAMEAVRQVLDPLFEPSFHPSSHGFRPGRSCHTAIAEAKEHVRDGYEWVVDIDLEKFFDRVNHQRLTASSRASRRSAAACADRTDAEGQGGVAGRCLSLAIRAYLRARRCRRCSRTSSWTSSILSLPGVVTGSFATRMTPTYTSAANGQVCG